MRDKRLWCIVSPRLIKNPYKIHGIRQGQGRRSRLRTSHRNPQAKRPAVAPTTTPGLTLKMAFKSLVIPNWDNNLALALVKDPEKDVNLAWNGLC